MSSRLVAPSSPAQQALRVLGVTVVAWGIKLPSAHAVARRAPHGHVPVRALRRLGAAGVVASPARFLAHSW
ncbi:MAG TPA: hypothetical protein VE084_19350 [Burkholderiaceae bacterium]|nr:hypothetical protein [Burkholderiaceae bacterium]